MEDFENTIQLLKNVLSDKNCDRMNKSVVTGYLGELLVYQKLQKEELKPEQLGKQSGYDIHVKNVKIEVKTSSLKDDGFGITNWGWTLLRKNQEIKYDLVICVALDDNLNVEGYYCISKKNLTSFLSPHGRFTSIMNRFQKFPQAPDESSSKKFQDTYLRTQQLFDEGKALKIHPNESLGEIIRKINH